MFFKAISCLVLVVILSGCSVALTNNPTWDERNDSSSRWLSRERSNLYKHGS